MGSWGYNPLEQKKTDFKREHQIRVHCWQRGDGFGVGSLIMRCMIKVN